MSTAVCTAKKAESGVCEVVICFSIEKRRIIQKPDYSLLADMSKAVKRGRWSEYFSRPGVKIGFCLKHQAIHGLVINNVIDGVGIFRIIGDGGG